jgi:CDP-diacylglycerol---serine O-phosphatidyltransferase
MKKGTPSSAEHKAPRLARFVPNAITIAALCTGLSAIRFALLERWELTVVFILIAAILDGMDGRIARLLRADSPFGAELDSLSDFISFGVAPAVILYLYSLSLWKGTGWAFALFFSTCMALRLARFNTNLGTAKPEWAKQFSVGVPAPAAALLALFPLVVSFALEEDLSFHPSLFALSLSISGLLMISRIPTYVLKSIRVPQQWVRLLLMMVALFIAMLFSLPWWSLCLVTIFYIFSIPLSWLSYRQKMKEENSRAS